MKINDRDKSSYLKGLLILAKRDKVLAESEEQIIKDIASRLGFSSDFYEYTLQNLIDNEFLTEEPVLFSDKKIAQLFIVDGFKLAHSDSHLDEREISWLQDTAIKNKIDMEWFNSKLKEIKSKPNQLSLNEFALYSII
ncbi:MAG: TerB family tellurite resistance protein [Ignavibacterium sp.]|nr:MAG: TerB family tellurite resistance protein [Ignavibacterium sp.]